MAKDREAWLAAIHRVSKHGTHWVTEQQQCHHNADEWDHFSFIGRKRRLIKGISTSWEASRDLVRWECLILLLYSKMDNHGDLLDMHIGTLLNVIYQPALSGVWRKNGYMYHSLIRFLYLHESYHHIVLLGYTQYKIKVNSSNKIRLGICQHHVANDWKT